MTFLAIYAFLTTPKLYMRSTMFDNSLKITFRIKLKYFFPLIPPQVCKNSISHEHPLSSPATALKKSKTFKQKVR